MLRSTLIAAAAVTALAGPALAAPQAKAPAVKAAPAAPAVKLDPACAKISPAVAQAAARTGLTCANGALVKPAQGVALQAAGEEFGAYLMLGVGIAGAVTLVVNKNDDDPVSP